MLALMEHQLEGIAWLKKTPRALLADSPGLGKTAQVLLAASPPVLIVAPAMLAGTWEDEIAKWRPEWSREDWTWVSYSSLCKREGRRVLPKPRDEYNRRWNVIICDEAQALKNRQAKQTQAMLKLAWKTERLYLVTGTPIPGWSHELAVPLRLLHEEGAFAYRSYWRFISAWFSTWQPPYGAPGHTEILGLRAGVSWEDFARENDLGTLMLRRLREDVLKDLPPLTETTIHVEMGTEQRKVYAGLKKDYTAWVAEAGSEVLALSDGSKYVKLAKVTTGISTLMEDPALKAGNCKLAAFAELLAEREGSPVVAFTHFRSTALAAVAAGEAQGRRCGLILGGLPQEDRDAAIRQFQAGELDLLVGTLGSLAEGVTLTAADTAIFIERSWRPSQIEQARRRIHRIGQTRPVTVLHLVTVDSLDQRIQAMLDAKQDQQIATLTAAALAALL